MARPWCSFSRLDRSWSSLANLLAMTLPLTASRPRTPGDLSEELPLPPLAVLVVVPLAQLRGVPDLDPAADADERRLAPDRGPLAQLLGQEDPALLVRLDPLGRAEEEPDEPAHVLRPDPRLLLHERLELVLDEALELA